MQKSTSTAWPSWLGLPHQHRGRRRRYGQSTDSSVNQPHRPVSYYTGLLILGVITLACFNMALTMADGLPVNPQLAERLHFLASHRLLWQLGWLNWMAAALGLLVFCHLLMPYVPPGLLGRIGLVLVGIGIAPDLSAEMIYAWVLPEIKDPATFALLDRIAMLLTGLIGNGAYCLGGLCLNLALFGNPHLSRGLLYFGLPAWIIGLLISVGTVMQLYSVTALFTAVAMVWNVLWMFWFCQVALRDPAKSLRDD